MTYQDQNRIILITYIVGVLLNLGVDTLIKEFPDVNTFINTIRVTTILTLWWLFYFYYGWRFPYLRKVLFRMNFNGTWYGSYESISAKSAISIGDIALRIQQNYLQISVNSFTELYSNYSISEVVKFDKKSNIYGISYTYSQQENNLFDVAKRNGTSELTLKLIGSEPWLEGTFWTIHGTQGKLKVKRISRKQIDTFSEARETAEAMDQ